MKVLLLSIIGALLLAGCKDSRPLVLYNDPAAATNHLPFNPLEEKVISLTTDKARKHMSILYGNEAAFTAARSGLAYPAGAVLHLLTWKQAEDAHWFGGRIPDSVFCAEAIEFITGSNLPRYTYSDGTTGQLQHTDDSSFAQQRVAAILSLRPLVTP